MPDRRFMYWGNNVNNLSFSVPAPTQVSAESEWGFDGARNADYVLRGDFVGRPIFKRSMSWSLILCTDWYAMNRFIEENRGVFWCNYFDDIVGKWLTRRFYRGNPKVEIIRIDKSTGEPDTWYRNATLNIIDTGEGS